MKPNCYQCKHRHTLPGGIRSTCRHPSFEAVLHISAECVVKDSNGYFVNPLNFDPVSVEECSGYTPLNEKERAA